MNGLQEKFLHGYQPLRLRSGRCGFRTPPVFSKKLPKYLFNLHLRCAIEMRMRLTHFNKYVTLVKSFL